MKDFFDPRVRLGARVHDYIIVAVALIAVVIASFGAGVAVEQHHLRNLTPQQIAARYPVTNEVPRPIPGHHPVAVRAVQVPIAADNSAYLPSVTDQFSIGACAAEASTYYDASYEWRRTHPGSWIRLSPRYPYDHYSDTYNNGQDGGSWPDQDLEIAATTGIPTFKQFPYGKAALALGLPAYAVDNPIPAWAIAKASAHRFTATLTQISSTSQNNGPGLIGAMEEALSNGKLVIAATPVTPAFDAASATNPYIDFSSQANNRGDHEITFYGYKIDPSAPGGAWFHFRNSWSKLYGLLGNAWYSARDVALFLYGAETLTIGPAA